MGRKIIKKTQKCPLKLNKNSIDLKFGTEEQRRRKNSKMITVTGKKKKVINKPSQMNQVFRIQKTVGDLQEQTAPFVQLGLIYPVRKILRKNMKIDFLKIFKGIEFSSKTLNFQIVFKFIGALGNFIVYNISRVKNEKFRKKYKMQKSSKTEKLVTGVKKISKFPHIELSQ